MTQLEGTFRVVSWDEQRYDAADGYPTFTHARVVHELAGGVEGEASICYLMVYRPDTTASFVGLATITATIGDKSGSFVMQDVGATENGVSRGRWVVLPGLGSGALRDLRGDGHFASSDGEATYLLDVSL